VAVSPAPSFRKPVRTVETEEENDDAALLGKATLAKLARATDVEPTTTTDEVPTL
jgi:hypothetical protein